MDNEMTKARYITRILGGIGLTVSFVFIAGSFAIDNWIHDVLLNTGFMALGALFTAAIVDRVVQYREESKWDDARRSAWERFRSIATILVKGIAIYYPDPTRTFTSQSNITGSQAKIDFGFPGRSLYANLEWIKHSRTEAAPAYSKGFPELEEYQIKSIIDLMDTCESGLSGCLTLFSQLLSPSLIDNTLGLLDVIRHERLALQVVWGEKHHQAGITNNPRPVLDSILLLGTNIVEEVNQRYGLNPKNYIQPTTG